MAKFGRKLWFYLYSKWWTTLGTIIEISLDYSICSLFLKFIGNDSYLFCHQQNIYQAISSSSQIILLTSQWEKETHIKNVELSHIESYKWSNKFTRRVFLLFYIYFESRMECAVKIRWLKISSEIAQLWSQFKVSPTARAFSNSWFQMPEQTLDGARSFTAHSRALVWILLTENGMTHINTEI